MTIIVSGGASGRETLSAARTYYVRTDGSDSNNGLANTAGGAFLTIQKAVDTAYTLDFNNKVVTIQVAAGTYAGGISVVGPPVGAKGAQQLEIVGDTTTPANCILTNTSNTLLQVSEYADILFKGFRVSASSTTAVLWSTRQGHLWFNSLEFNTSAGAIQVWVTDSGLSSANGNYTIIGGGAYHFYADTYGEGFPGFSTTITLTGTPAFSGAFATATLGGILETSGNTYTGAATGQRYNISANGIISTSGGGITYFPGNSAGTVTTGGLYL